MSSIPVRRTTRVARPAKDSENANARVGTIRTRSMAGDKAAATSATTRATASTAASKAKAVAVGDGSKSIKRKREALVEVTGLVTNNNKTKITGKDAAVAPAKTKETVVAKPKTVIKPPTKRPAGTAVPKRTVARAGSENRTVQKTHEQTKVAPVPAPIPPIPESMEVDDAKHVSKRRHTDEIDESQVDADVVASHLQAVEPSVQLEPAAPAVQLWDDLDADDWDDPVMVSEYVADVCDYLKEIELSTLPKADYMKEQNEITWEHRGILVDWILQVHARFGLQAESLFLSVNLLDRFLGSRPISISKLQLVGLACFFIATKYEETYAPSVKEIVLLIENQYTAEEILTAERYILRTLEWDLRAPGPMGWLRRASKADDCELRARTVAKYLLEIGIVERRLVGIVPSLIAAAAIWLSRLALGREEWTANMEHYSTYKEEELLPIATVMLEYIITNPVQHEYLFKKYTSKRYFRCSSVMQQWALERWPENGDVNLVKDLPYIKDEVRRHREYAERKAAAAAREQDEEDL